MGQPASKAERDAKIYARRSDGLALAAIGREFGLSTETVRIVVKQMKLKAWWREIEETTQRARLAELAIGSRAQPSRHAVPTNARDI
jgi:hypothetical protein